MAIINLGIDYHEISKEAIFKIYQGKTIGDLMLEYDDDARSIINILTCYKVKNGVFNVDNAIYEAIKNYFLQNHIDANRILVISDTHIGGISFKKEIFEVAYNYASRNGIKTIIHCGDIIEGNSCTLDRVLLYSEQIEKLKELCNNMKDMTIYYILGNHDYNLINFNQINILNDLNTIPNLRFLGIRYSYVSLIDKLPIKLYHEIKVLRNEYMPEIYTNISFEGHHHSYREKDGTIYVPSLYSVDYIDFGGFIDLEVTDDTYHYKYIGIDNKFKETNKEDKIIYKKIRSIN